MFESNINDSERPPSRVRLDPKIPKDEVQALTGALRKAMLELNPSGLADLKNHPLILDLGSSDFYEELDEQLSYWRSLGAKESREEPGYCHNCMPNAEVTIYWCCGERIGLDYHKLPGGGLEIGICNYCQNYPVTEENKDDLLKHFDKALRDPAAIPLTVEFAELSFSSFFVLEPLASKLHDKIQLIYQPIDEKHEQLLAVDKTRTLNRLGDLQYRVKKATDKLELVFWGKDQYHDILSEYSGTTGLLAIKNDTPVYLYYFEVRFGKITLITCRHLNEAHIEALPKIISRTGYFI